MSKLPRGIISEGAGKIGNTIVSNWKGIQYVKSRPALIKDPRTPLQETRRSRFARIMNIMVPLSPAVRIGFKGYATRMSAFNAAVSYNLKNAFSGNPDSCELLYSCLLFTHGLYPGIDEGCCTLAGQGKVRISWNVGPLPQSFFNSDSIIAVLINETAGTSVYYTDACLWTKGSIQLDLPGYNTGDTIHCYLGKLCPEKAFTGNYVHGISDSRYVGSIVAS